MATIEVKISVLHEVRRSPSGTRYDGWVISLEGAAVQEQPKWRSFTDEDIALTAATYMADALRAVGLKVTLKRGECPLFGVGGEYNLA
jgi:hypothetical protein